ncbi:MAG: hypothetical protein K8T90_08680 [Planctomycetes bacterium]|nr:hypothetical protein [Planctomycetota bacterium]
MTKWSTKKWEQVPFDDVCAGILAGGGIGGHDALPAAAPHGVPPTAAERYRALVDGSWLFLRFLPPCDWFRVRIEVPDDLSDLRVIAEESWFPDPPSAVRDLHSVATSLVPGSPHEARVTAWEGTLDVSHLDRRIALFGRGRDGPFSILDGNHRLLALTRQAGRDGIRPMRFDAHVGLSFGPCRWHGDAVRWEERSPRSGEDRRYVLRVW